MFLGSWFHVVQTVPIYTTPILFLYYSFQLNYSLLPQIPTASNLFPCFNPNVISYKFPIFQIMTKTISNSISTIQNECIHTSTLQFARYLFQTTNTVLIQTHISNFIPLKLLQVIYPLFQLITNPQFNSTEHIRVSRLWILHFNTTEPKRNSYSQANHHNIIKPPQDTKIPKFSNQHQTHLKFPQRTSSYQPKPSSWYIISLMR